MEGSNAPYYEIVCQVCGFIMERDRNAYSVMCRSCGAEYNAFNDLLKRGDPDFQCRVSLAEMSENTGIVEADIFDCMGEYGEQGPH